MQTVGDMLAVVDAAAERMQEKAFHPESVPPVVVEIRKQILSILDEHSATITPETQLAGNPRLFGKICGILSQATKELLAQQPDLQPHIRRFISMDAPALHGVTADSESWDAILHVQDRVTREGFLKPDELLTSEAVDIVDRQFKKYVQFRLIARALPRILANKYPHELQNGGVPLDRSAGIATQLNLCLSHLDYTVNTAKRIGKSFVGKCTVEQYFSQSRTFFLKNFPEFKGETGMILAREVFDKVELLSGYAAIESFDLNERYGYFQAFGKLDEEAIFDIVSSTDAQAASFEFLDATAVKPSRLSSERLLTDLDQEIIQRFRQAHAGRPSKKIQRDIRALCDILNRQNHFGLPVICPRDIKDIVLAA